MHPKVERALAEAGVSFRVRRHDELREPVNSPADCARQIGYELERITKTLLVRSPQAERFALVVAPAASRVSFPAVAQALNVKKVEVAREADLAMVTGYSRNGVSPLGVDSIPVFVDNSLSAFATILIGAGSPGVEIEIAPNDLAHASGATWLSVTIQ